ncbi:glycosyl hydrolase [Olivibacter sp. CPCC 100613]|uniref:glycosyl hydrolase n=1 Tax=Olivibacter sp. CPCC 100613 TaxID=3079931 RepID=UPI002FFA0D09
MKELIKLTIRFVCSMVITVVSAQDINLLRQDFIHPPSSAKPGVYWYFMDGNMTAESMTKDLEAMKVAGIGNLIFLEVNVGVPRGQVDFLSEEWTSLFAHAEREARRLGIEITLGIGPGWTGSGGPWVRGDQSMQHLVASEVIVSANEAKKITLPIPLPHKPFFGEEGYTEEFKSNWMEYYKDVAVLAFPFEESSMDTIANIEEKALYERAPYSSGIVKSLLSAPTAGKSKQQRVISKTGILELTDHLESNGTLNWKPSDGKWKIMRFGSRNNGAITRPAPRPGIGFESDKFDTVAINFHLNHYLGKIMKKIEPIRQHQIGGLKRLHMDSWEMGAQNWTANFRDEFHKRRGYDPLRYYPVYIGKVVGSAEESERFLWDLRQTSQELILENHAGFVKNFAKKYGLELSIEPYDMNPTADLDLGSVADVPMAEFWSKGYGFNASYSVIEATSIAHIMGRSLVPAEAFTAQNNEAWKQYPGSMKNQGDWAFASGINRFVYHTFQNQFLPDSLRPGATMGPYGVHWDRNQTWWPLVHSYHAYVSRCQYLLQQGRTVADMLYLTPENSPQVFVPPRSAVIGDTIGDRRGFNFDGCSASQLMNASVKDGKVTFPGGGSYQILILPDYETMTPELLTKIGELIFDGALVVGNPPMHSPSLTNYPECDHYIRLQVEKIWGATDTPTNLSRRNYGKGLIVWGEKLKERSDMLYPDYELTALILKNAKVKTDFYTEGDLRYTHRTHPAWDLYFVANKTDEIIQTEGIFRDASDHPQLWNPLTGEIRALADFQYDSGSIKIPLRFEAYQSFFIVFPKQGRLPDVRHQNFDTYETLVSLNGPWNLAFDPVWGGPADTTFSSLKDWSQEENESVKYYSGRAYYHKKFNLPATVHKNDRLFLDLGEVYNLACVRVNGQELGILWTAPWRIELPGKYLKKKDNFLEIEVINLWPNRLIGDEKLPSEGVQNGEWPQWLQKKQPRTSKRFTFTTYQPYKLDSPLLKSGLLGPVMIKRVKN